MDLRDPGWITGDGVRNLTLNESGQIIAVAGVATYAYDGHGKRIRSTLVFQRCAKTEPGAQFALGLMHNFGWGVSQHLGDAIRFYRDAAQSGHLLALKNLGLAEIKMGHRLKGFCHYSSAVLQMIPVALPNPEDRRIRIT